MASNQPRGRGFTLIELMTVVTIIGILAAIAVPNFLNARVRAQTARSMAEQEMLVWALESYSIDEDGYPPNAETGVPGPGDLVPLSTPVPYVSMAPRDIFLAPGSADARDFIETGRGGNPFYFYVNFIQETGSRADLAAFGRAGSANYVVYGMGPAFAPGVDAMNPETWIDYDPSNGTVSAGVITTFGP